METPEKAASPAVTVAGFALLLVAVVTFAQFVMQGLAAIGNVRGVWATGPAGNYLVLAAVLVWGGIAMIRRWPRWRIWSGVLAWLMIFYLLDMFFELYSALDPVGQVPGGRIRYSLADEVRVFIPFLACLIGLFVLWARQREPASSDVTVAGILLIVVPALLFLVAEPSPVVFVMAAVPAAGGFVVARRSRGWRFVAGSIAWILIALCVAGIVKMIAAPPIGGDEVAWIDAIGQTVMAIMLGGFGGFVLRAKRGEPKSAAAASG
jgi:hypothetical protein